MATYVGSAAVTGKSARYDNDGPVSIYSQYSSSATLSSGDVIQMAKVEPGARIISCRLVVDGVDDVQVCLGDGVTENKYLATASVGSTVKVGPDSYSGLGYEYTATDTIDIKYCAGQTASSVVVFRTIIEVDYEDSTVRV
jgi:hypothetical protein